MEVVVNQYRTTTTTKADSFMTGLQAWDMQQVKSHIVQS